MAKITKTTIATREQDGRCLELRKAGLTYERIAEALGLSDRSIAWKGVNRALQLTIQEPADELRKIEGERLDALLRAMWPQAMQGKGWAVDRCLSVMERRARLLGLDAPLKSRIEVITEDAVDAAIRQLEADLEDRSATGEAALPG